MLPKSAKDSENIFDEDPGPNNSTNSVHNPSGGSPNIFIYAEKILNGLLFREK